MGAAEEEASQIEDPMGQLRPVDMTADEVERVREQERHRFERPWEYFRYELTCQGKPYSVVVPPIKGYTRKVGDANLLSPSRECAACVR